MNSPIRAVVLTPGEPARLDYIDADIKTMQRLVGGYVQSVPASNGTICYMNEEGKVNGLPPCRPLACDGRVIDVAVGTLVLVGRGDKGFDSLTSEQAKFWLDRLEDPTHPITLD